MTNNTSALAQAAALPTKRYNIYVDYVFIKRNMIMIVLKILNGKAINVKYDADTFTCEAVLTAQDLGELICEMNSIRADDFYIEISGNDISYGYH